MHVIFALLIFSVALVNGWTDAPSAIAGCVCTRSLTPRSALILAAVCNFSGAVIMAVFRPGVARTLYGIADFGSDPASALVSLCCALASVNADKKDIAYLHRFRGTDLLSHPYLRQPDL